MMHAVNGWKTMGVKMDAEYSETNHNCWDKTSQDQKVIAWRLKQKKGKTSTD